MRHRPSPLVLVFAAMLFSLSCGQRTSAPSQQAAPGQVRNFTGAWTATGDRQSLRLGPDHQVWTFQLSGSLLLEGEQRLANGFKADLIGLSDTRSGMQGRCVWTDERGEQVFSELRSETISPGQTITGRFIGGTGRYAGISGEYSFQWQRMVNDVEDGEVSGRVNDLKGWFRFGPPSNPPPSAGGRP